MRRSFVGIVALFDPFAGQPEQIFSRRLHHIVRLKWRACPSTF